MKKTIILLLTVLLISCVTPVVGSKYGFNQTNNDYSVLYEHSSKQQILVKCEDNKILIRVGGADRDTANPVHSYFKLTDWSGNILYENNGPDMVSEYHGNSQGIPILASVFTIDIKEDILQLILESKHPVDGDNKIFIYNNCLYLIDMVDIIYPDF